MKKTKILVALLIIILTFFIYRFTSNGQTPYDYFTRLSNAFINGRYYLTEKPSFLTELIPSTNNRYFVVYPPMPAILLIPFVKIFGQSFPQELMSQLLGAGIGLLTFATAFKIKREYKFAIYFYLFISFGTIVWFLSSVGSSWYLGQISSAFFLTWAVYESISKKRPLLMGLLIGAAYLSRIHTILALPFFIFALKEKLNLKSLILLALGISPFVLFNFAYNAIRFGSIFDQAYFILPKILNEENMPWFAQGVVNVKYIPWNLQAAFLSLPKIKSSFPFIEPSWAGLAIWITTPGFIFALFGKIKDRINLLSWFSIAIIFLVVASHGGTGWAQFGYRFAVDFYPFLMLLTIKAVAKQDGPKWYHWMFLIAGITVNLWGVLWINKFGWVSF